MKKRTKYIGFLLGICVFSGCARIDKIENAVEIPYQVAEEDEIPEEMKGKIEEMKKKPFQITYEDGDNLYIGQGYGEKDMEGYEIIVDHCTESEQFVYIHTILQGPKEEGEKVKSWPYIIIKMQSRRKQVIFLNELGG